MEKVLRHWPKFPITNGEIHGLDIEHSEANTRVH
jgi:hypothetical protein